MINSSRTKTFHQKLREKIDEYAHQVYKVSRKFPKDELYGLTSQLRRAVISIPLNYIEGYARDLSGKDLVYRNFLEISFGSLKETEYILEFACKEGLIPKSDYEKLCPLSQEIGAMLLGIMGKLKKTGHPAFSLLHSSYHHA